jgi:hypothetical protein
MDAIPTQPANSRKSSRRGTRGHRRPKRLPNSDETNGTSQKEPAESLRFERRASGTAVTGPGFYIWDADHEAAVRWAEQLARGLSSRRGRSSPASIDR